MFRPKILSRHVLQNIRGQLILVALILLLAACANTSAPLENTEWKLVSLRGGNLIAGSESTLEFTRVEIGGSSGCNSYGGKYTARGGDALVFSDIIRTEMFCLGPEGIMEQEALYLKSLLEVASYRMSGNRLELFSASGERLLEYSR